jgi:cytidine deaminase
MFNISEAPQDLKDLYKMALLARGRAYAPYSGHFVGAAIRLKNGRLYSGCNVENSSYGGTNCAERVAIQKAVSEEGLIGITEIMIVTESDPPWPPCGFCRQVIAEFTSDATIYMANLIGTYERVPFHTLFPRAFTPKHLEPK